MYAFDRTVYSRVQKFPKKVSSGLLRKDNVKPNFKDKGYRDMNLDIISIYERKLRPRMQGLELDRRLDEDER